MAALLLPACAVNAPPIPDGALHIAGATIELDLDPDLPVSRPVVVEWVRRAATAVTHYLRHFPVKHLVITVKKGRHGAVGGGVTYGGARITVRFGPETTAEALKKDWVLTHEMFHLAFPTLNDRYRWMMEGLSDYLEPIARAGVGQLTPEAVWREMVENLPQGLPTPDEKGLDGTRDWARIYWGGDLFWLLADVRIRVATRDRRGVGDAIRAIIAAGGTGNKDWPLEQVLQIGDRATGTTVLKTLHEELGLNRGQVDLDELWKKLGITYENGGVHFDDSAPWAKIRVAITAGD